jgi:hypothetical protein
VPRRQYAVLAAVAWPAEHRQVGRVQRTAATHAALVQVVDDKRRCSVVVTATLAAMTRSVERYCTRAVPTPTAVRAAVH